jgi:hypothetical protein
VWIASRTARKTVRGLKNRPGTPIDYPLFADPLFFHEDTMKKLSQALVAAVFALFALVSYAQDYAGVVKTSKGASTAERAGQQIALAPGVQLRQGDVIVTGDIGYVGITMRDDTLLTLGPGSSLTLDDYAFDPKTHDGSFLASLTKGVLSVVTGLIAKRSPESFVVKTRISTMGVRGTEFIVEANEE